MGSWETTNSVAAFCVASETYDVDGMLATLAPDAELISPLSGRMVFQGHEDLRILLSATYASLHELKWTDDVLGEGGTRVAVSAGKIAGVRFSDAMVFELDETGQIRRLRPHLRPLPAIVVFAAILAPKMARHFGIMRRATAHK